MMYEKELELAVTAVTKAAEYLKDRSGIHVDVMVDKDIKLSSDKGSEKIILECLKESGIPVLSEECGFVGNEGEFCWIVDPIDGTLNYFRGMDELVCISVALWHNQKPLLGVIYRFAMDELFSGVVGEGAWLNGKPLYPADTIEVGKAVMATGFPVKRSYTTESLDAFVKQVQQFKKVRMFGTAALMATFVAAGRIDAYFEEEIMLWDIAAATAIVLAAGGAVDVLLLQDSKCICRCFATQALMEDFYAKGL